MPRLPIGVGDRGAQKRFIANNQAFLLEYPLLRKLFETVVLRTLKPPPQEEVDRLLALPDDDPSVIAFEDQMTADRVVFGLGWLIVDDFGELLTLSGNGLGIGAYKILRGMYERIVTSAYIAKNPSEARPFVEDDVIKKWKLWQRILEFWPELKDSVPAEKIAALEADFIAAKAERPRGQKEWTSLNLSDMAKSVNINLYAIYGACYLEPTFHTHATGFGLSARFRRTDDGAISYQETSEKEARTALQLAHNLMLRFLELQNDYFRLGLEAEIKERIDAFQRIWKHSPGDREGKP